MKPAWTSSNVTLALSPIAVRASAIPSTNVSYPNINIRQVSYLADHRRGQALESPLAAFGASCCDDQSSVVS